MRVSSAFLHPIAWHQGKRASDGSQSLSQSDAVAFPSSNPAGHSHRVDCLRVLPGGRLASKGGDGRVIVWDAAGAKTQRASWKVPSADKAHGARFGVTPDGELLVAGGNAGEVHAFSTATGTKLASLSPGKARHSSLSCLHGALTDVVSPAAQIRSPVLACAITDDCCNVLASYATGIIARWEVVNLASAAAAADDAEGGADD